MLSSLNKLKVEDIMSKDFIQDSVPIDREEDLELMISENKKEIIITDQQGKIINILTLTDFSGTDKIKQSELAKSSQEIITTGPKTKVIKAREIMQENGIGRLPVVENNEILGIVRKENLLTGLYIGSKKINKHLYKILNNIQEAICVLNSKGEVIFWNSRAENLYQVSQNEILGTKIKDFFEYPLIWEVLQKEKSMENVHHSPRQGAHVAISAHPIYINDEIAGAVSTERDITEVTNLIWKLKETQKRLRDCKQSSGEKITRKNTQDSPFQKIKGESRVIKGKIKKAQKIAKNNCNILITGETGTGKELFARSIHKASELPGDFVPVNCSAIAENLFESEMFGYVEGAFTGASEDGKIGYFEMADNGTLFLDEIGEMPFSKQAKLLRVLQEGRIKKVGADEYIDVDVRVISATNRDLEKLVEKGEFREDLYYRIDVINLELPSLRERPEDIPDLLEEFIEDFCQKNSIRLSDVELDSDVLSVLMEYDWPGNIRELKNIAKHLIVFSSDGKVTLEALPSKILNNLDQKLEIEKGLNTLATDKKKLDLDENVKELEKNLIKEALKRTEGNKKQAAELLNIPRSTLYYKIKFYDVTIDNI